jgi:sugar lactone lactonase YvrE
MNDTLNAKLLEVIPVGNTLGEGVLWDNTTQRLLWTDIQEKRLYRYAPASKSLERFDLPERLGSFGLMQGSGTIVAAFASGFATYDMDQGRLEWLTRPKHAAANVRFNDGRVDRVGRFWAGSMVEGEGERSGQLYCLRHGRSESHLSGIGISNSLCFSPNGDTLYFADSPHRTIWRFKLDEATGTLSERSVFASTPKGAYPDGSNVDAEGHLWNAQWAAGRVVRYAPDGSESGHIALPVSQPTCVAFGGRNLDVLYVTTAKQELSAEALAAQPQAGHVFAYQLDIRGLPEPRYIP